MYKNKNNLIVCVFVYASVYFVNKNYDKKCSFFFQWGRQEEGRLKIDHWW